MQREPKLSSVVVGLVLGSVAGLFLAGTLTLAGGFLTIWTSFEGDDSSIFRYLMMPPAAGLLVGGAVGAGIAFVRSQRGRQPPPARPDLP